MPLSPADHLRAVERRVNTVTREGQEVRRVVLTRTLAASADEVWSAVTDPARLAQWWVPVTGDLQVGGRVEVDDLGHGEVLACVAPERFALTWVVEGRASSLDVSLRPVPGSTLLQLDHTDPLDASAWAQLGPAAVGLGWELALASLAEHLSEHLSGHLAGSGPSGPHPLAEAAEEWAAAAIADGDDPDAAVAAAQRCVATYAGDR